MTIGTIPSLREDRFYGIDQLVLSVRLRRSVTVGIGKKHPDEEVAVVNAQMPSDLPEYRESGIGDTQESWLSAAPEPGVGTEPGRLERLAAGQACLVVRNGRLAGTTYELPEKAVVGRHPSSSIFLNDITVSRRHAQLHRLGDR